MFELKIAGVQLLDVQNDVATALSLIVSFATEAEQGGARLVCFPEGFLQGYSTRPADVATRAMDVSSVEFSRVLRALGAIRAVVVVGLIERIEQRFYNTAAVIEGGRLVGCYRKVHLSRAESAVFTPGDDFPVFDVDGVTFGINICNDLNFSAAADAVRSKRARLLVCPCNNMMRFETAERWKPRHNLIRANRAREASLWLLSADVTGARDGRISYGPTALIDPEGTVVMQAPLLVEGVFVAEI